MTTHFLSITEQRALLDGKKASATELAQQALSNIEQRAKLNAFVDVQPELTLAQAKAADERLAAGDQSALLGIPMAHKDIFVTQGWASTAASRMLAGYKSPFDAEVVHRLSSAGAVCLGKLNCDEFAMGSSNENSHFGSTLNPWDDQAVPGGSSGGSAAAVAAGLVTYASGTDTGGFVLPEPPQPEWKVEGHEGSVVMRGPYLFVPEAEPLLAAETVTLHIEVLTGDGRKGAWSATGAIVWMPDDYAEQVGMWCSAEPDPQGGLGGDG